MSDISSGLANKVVVVTGGAGELGHVIARKFLYEDATVVLTDLFPESLAKRVQDLKREFPQFQSRIEQVVLDGSNPKSALAGVKEIIARHKRIDVLINNAGSVGPKQPLNMIPLSPADLQQLDAVGIKEKELLRNAIGSLLGCAWFTTQAMKPYFSQNASVINVSTIFSRTEYFGRIAYVVPKAALNSLSGFMARELGHDARQIRVNTVFPGPIHSDRIQSVFAAMDKMRGAKEGTTKAEVGSQMTLGERNETSIFLTKEEIADTILFLGKNASSGLSAHEFEVTRGLRKPEEGLAHATILPDLAACYFDGRIVTIFGGDDVQEAFELAATYHGRGAQVLLTFENENSVASAREKFKSSPGVRAALVEVRDCKSWTAVDAYIREQSNSGPGLMGWSAVVLPKAMRNSGAEVLSMTADETQDFMDTHIERTVAIAKNIDRILCECDQFLAAAPSVLFFSPVHDEKCNHLAEIQRAAIEQLIRVWRHEATVGKERSARKWLPLINQIVRFGSEQAAHFDRACKWALALSSGRCHSEPICISLEYSSEYQDERMENGSPHRGLHMDRVVLITGGSEGIGGEITRQMALAGAKITVAERSTEKLEAAWERLVKELRAVGFRRPEERLLLIPKTDVSKMETLQNIVQQTVEKFGRIDFLVNNAGLVGGEKMVVDLPLETWRQTLAGNLISNYHLMLKSLPHMKRQQFGHVFNLSSYFGTARHGYVAYTNRSDYAVSKAGQIALVEAFAKFVGPEVQLNAGAPGPVDGARLNGTYGRPGLYMRRAKLILENKRLNQIQAALHADAISAEALPKLIGILAQNRISSIAQQAALPDHLKELIRQLTIESDGLASAYLLDKDMFSALLHRLYNGGKLANRDVIERALNEFVTPDQPLFSDETIETQANATRNDMIRRLALQRMPTDRELADEVVDALSHRIMTGETVHASCGFRYDGAQLGSSFRHDGADLVGCGHSEMNRARAEAVAKQTVMIFGDAMYEEMAKLTATYLTSEAKPKKVVVVLGSIAGREAFEKHFASAPVNSAKAIIEVIDKAELERDAHAIFRKHGFADSIVSFPQGSLAVSGIGGNVNAKTWDALPSSEELTKILEENVTNHFVLAKAGGLIANSNVVFITPVVRKTGATPVERALVEFVRKTLRPLTVCAGRESSYMGLDSSFFQIEADEVSERFFKSIMFMSLVIERKYADQESVNLRKAI